MRKAWVALAVAAFVTGGWSCAGNDRGPTPDTALQQTSEVSMPTVTTPGGKVIEVEVAADDETRARGLMFRESLADDRGMIFLFPQNAVLSFWMKNTYIPLDMIWLDENAVIAHIEANVPPCQADPCTNYGPRQEARYVLELSAGGAKRYGLKKGDRLQLRGVENYQVR